MVIIKLMGYHNKLSVEILGDRNRAEILRFLYKNSPNRFSQKQMSVSLGIPLATMSRTCRKLENLNVVNHLNVGKTILYSLAEGSYIVRGFLLPIFKGEEVFLKKLVSDIVSGLKPDLIKQIKEILVFGSILDDKDTPESDIDLAIVLFDDQHGGAHACTLARDGRKKIEEHFVYESVKLRIRLDPHIFLDCERKKGKGISLTQVYEHGTVLWRNER